MRIILLFPILFFALFWQMQQASAAVSVNEIAWMGTTDSPSNEWVELANDGSTAVDLTEWVLSIEGKKDIALSGSIAGSGFYLIERTDDTTVPTVTADLIASFGTGIANSGAVLSLKDATGVVVDRVDGSQGWTISGTAAGNNTTKETAQKTRSGWTTGTPTPRATNIGVDVQSPQPQSNAPTVIETNTPLSSAVDTSLNKYSTFPIDPQIFADAGPSARTISTGAPLTFTGKVVGLKKEPIENARMVWSFGDGGRAEGQTVSHVYYYPGEYVAVLDAASGHYSASDRATIRVIAPLLSLCTGGDSLRSFVAIENKGGEEIDLSEWQIEATGKIFVFPHNTIIPARKTLKLASEITGLVTPGGSSVVLRFPNGTQVDFQESVTASLVAPQTSVIETKTKEQVSAFSSSRTLTTKAHTQEATVAEAVTRFDATTSPSDPTAQKIWPWYGGVALLGFFALLGIRFVREKQIKNSNELTADDFEIVEEDRDSKKSDIF